MGASGKAHTEAANELDGFFGLGVSESLGADQRVAGGDGLLVELVGARVAQDVSEEQGLLGDQGGEARGERVGHDGFGWGFYTRHRSRAPASGRLGFVFWSAYSCRLGAQLGKEMRGRDVQTGLRRSIVGEQTNQFVRITCKDVPNVGWGCMPSAVTVSLSSTEAASALTEEPSCMPSRSPVAGSKTA